MAKLIGPIGSKMRGKVGQIVAAKTVGGDTAIRSYQPQVKNPKTQRQMAARNRFSVVSYVASKLAGVLEIGFAAASGAAKMYPRNMAVRDWYHLDAAIVNDGSDVQTIDWTSLPVSSQSGITVAPTGTYTEGTKKVTFTNTTDVELAADETLGVVVLVVTDEMDTIAVLKASAATGVTIPDAIVNSGLPFNVLAFYKAIKSSGTNIPAEQWPWKYPSRTGASAFIWRQQA